MSLASRQKTCAACGKPFRCGDRTEVEPFIDGAIRYLAVHPGHSTYAVLRERSVEARLTQEQHEAPHIANAA
ncbi:hypothetical protein [Amycolatopsis nigrescens]|uniref:hypothetical protein n=1 Tax=Amycolatopsis nigrescens TaxID=381445 RepID=UPI00037FACAF|nr:hypothetical protein [Amycolatopsis nigrescens]